MATGQRTVSTAFLLHQSENSSHLFSYCALVDGALAFRMVFLTVAVQNLSGGSGPAVAKPRAGGGGGLGAKSDPPVVIGGPFCRGGAMESCNRACAAVETRVSLAKRGPPKVACEAAGAPSEVWEDSVAAVGKHTEDSVASREPSILTRGLVTSIQENQRGQWADSSEAKSSTSAPAKETPYPLHPFRVKPPLARKGASVATGSPRPDSGPLG